MKAPRHGCAGLQVLGSARCRRSRPIGGSQFKCRVAIGSRLIGPASDLNGPRDCPFLGWWSRWVGWCGKRMPRTPRHFEADIPSGRPLFNHPRRWLRLPHHLRFWRPRGATTRDGVIPPSRCFAIVSPWRDAAWPFGARSSLSRRTPLKQTLDGGLTPGPWGGALDLLAGTGERRRYLLINVTRLQSRDSPSPVYGTGRPLGAGRLIRKWRSSLNGFRSGRRSTPGFCCASLPVLGWRAQVAWPARRASPTSHNVYL